MTSPLKRKLEKKLKKYLNELLIADIFLYGSSFKDKLDFRDVDVSVLFRAKEYEKVEEILFKMKKELQLEKLHLEPLYVEDIFKESLFSSLLHESFSLRHHRMIGEMIGYTAYWMFSYNLDNLNPVEKVRFSQALYGREGRGLLQENKGKVLGKGAFLVPVEKEHLFKEMLVKFKVKYKASRALVKD